MDRRRGLLLVVSSPSGGGKTTLCQRLVQEAPPGVLGVSISFTTRAPRGSERDGVAYHFVDDETFDAMIEEDRFAEWARVHDKRYGTSRETVETALAQGRDLLFDIDWQGGYQLRDRYPDDTALVFVLPPSMEELARRLRGRGTDSPEAIQRRLEVARAELAHYVRYDYLLVNDDLGRAYEDFRSIYRAAQLGRARQEPLARALLDEKD